MKARGGYRENSGRKPKDEEQTIIEKLKPYDDVAISKLYEAIDEGKDWAIKLFLNYRFGMPNNKTDITSNGQAINEAITIRIVDGDSSD
jgi:hypothetical protein